MQSNLNSIHVMLQKIKSSSKRLTDEFHSAISHFMRSLRSKMNRSARSDTSVSDQLKQSMGVLLEDRKRLVDELAQIRLQIEGLAASRQPAQGEQSHDVLEKDQAIAQASELRIRLEEVQKDRDEIVKDRQRLWEEYQKLAQSRDELRQALDAKEGGAGV